MGSAVVASAVGPDVGASGLSGSTAAEAAVSTIVAVDAASGKGISCVADAMHLMAGLYVRGVPGFRVGHRPDYGRAFTLYVSAARRDHPDAIFQVALCYELGSGVAPSAPRSVQYYRKAAALNHPGAMLRLGMAQLHGELGQKVAPRDALKWLRLSCKYADERYPQALYELALLHDVGVKNVIWQDYPYMIELLERGSDLGHALSQLKLGEAYEYGKFGCSVEPSKSVYYYSLAAANGNAEAMFELGGWYLTGAVDEAHDFELPASEVQARRWTALAAEGGYPRAMFALGFFLESGIGRTEGDQRDQEVAMLWYKRAAEAGDEKAIKRLEKEGVDTKEYRDEKARRKKAKKKDREAQKARRGRGGSSGTSRWMADSGLLVVDTVRAASGLRRRPDIPDELDGGNKCAVM
ncbi:hypothetical protein DFJ73DRAFT_628468 [Zopfochytrium polystomum]|nr:hypothetical protein DFJ73DRAFT_628468 [Zopfochytrium polystomum]